MITNENKKLAQWAMEYALKNGCQSSRVTLYNGSSSSFEIRDMKIDRLQQASEQHGGSFVRGRPLRLLLYQSLG